MSGKTLAHTIVVAATLAISACSGASDPAAPTSNTAHAAAPDPRLAQIAAITDHCGLPRSSLRLNGDELTFQPPRDAHFEAVDCMLREIRSAGLDLSTAMGFVGNEYYSRGDNAQAR